jgi:hypothetical protein
MCEDCDYDGELAQQEPDEDGQDDPRPGPWWGSYDDDPPF